MPPPSLVLLLDGTVDLDSGAIRRRAGAQALSPQERALFARLVATPGVAVDRFVLAAAIGRGDDGVRAVDFAMRRLRAKVEADPARPRHIHTVYGSGYRFEPLDREAVPEPTFSSRWIAGRITALGSR